MYLASASRIAAGVKCADVGDSAVAEAGTPIMANSVFADLSNEFARGQFRSLESFATDMSSAGTFARTSRHATERDFEFKHIARHNLTAKSRLLDATK